MSALYEDLPPEPDVDIDALAALDPDRHTDGPDETYQRLLSTELDRQRAQREARAQLVAEEEARRRDRLDFGSVADFRARVAARGPRKWLIEGLWIEATPLVFGAQEKFGKTVAMVDFLVSLASGTPWMGTFPVAMSGLVLGFFAEDDDSEILRRLDAVCRGRGLNADELPIRLCFMAPNLSSEESVAEVRREIAEHRPVVAVLDPLYLAIGENGDSANLYKMGTVLNAFKAACAETRTAPAVITHWNKTGVGTGSSRLTGTGTTQWARTIISGSVESVDVERVEVPGADDGPDVTQTRVTSVLSLEFTGNSIAPRTETVRRRMWAEDPLDLDSPLHYEVESWNDELRAPGAGSVSSSAAPTSAAARSLAVLSRTGRWMSAADVQDADAQARPLTRDGSQAKPLRVDTVYRALEKLCPEKVLRRTASDGQTVEYCSRIAGSGTQDDPFRQGGGLEAAVAVHSDPSD